jgi:hypothetical protein
MKRQPSLQRNRLFDRGARKLMPERHKPPVSTEHPRGHALIKMGQLLV